MNNERFSIPEILFHPSDVGIQEMGLSEAIVHSIESLDEGTYRLRNHHRSNLLSQNLVHVDLKLINNLLLIVFWCVFMPNYKYSVLSLMYTRPCEILIPSTSTSTAPEVCVGRRPNLLSRGWVKDTDLGYTQLDLGFMQILTYIGSYWLEEIRLNRFHNIMTSSTIRVSCFLTTSHSNASLCKFCTFVIQ